MTEEEQKSARLSTITTDGGGAVQETTAMSTLEAESISEPTLLDELMYRPGTAYKMA